VQFGVVHDAGFDDLACAKGGRLTPQSASALGAKEALDLCAAVGCLLIDLGGARSREGIAGDDGVQAMRAPRDFAAVGAVAENLWNQHEK